MAEPSDEELLNLYYEGDAKAIRAFMARHSGRVIAYAEAKGLRHEVAVEVAQEAFLKLHRFIHQYEKGRPALAWFFTIVHRCVIDSYRGSHNRESATEAEFFDGLEGEESALDSAQQDQDVNALLEILPLDQRKLIESRVFEGRSFKEIADSTGKTEVSLRKMYERTRATLRAQFGLKGKEKL